jgi:hypothetical protein
MFYNILYKFRHIGAVAIADLRSIPIRVTGEL